ncbi:MAG: hypothetical protein IKO47_02210, partial [Ruminococcus sp.]|nr:hypothetical protein [Ruminococcus sp.]
STTNVKIAGGDGTHENPYYFEAVAPAVTALTAENVSIANLTYTGSALTPEIKIGDTTLTADTDYTYTVTDSENNAVTSVVNAGTYNVTVTAKDGSAYTGSATVQWTVSPITLNADNTVAGWYDETNGFTSSTEYTGSDVAPTIYYKKPIEGGYTYVPLTKGTDYAASDLGEYLVTSGVGFSVSGAPINAGTYYYGLSNIDGSNYSAVYDHNTWLAVGTFTVTKADSAITSVPAANYEDDETSLYYSGQAQELVTEGTATGGTMQYALLTEDQAIALVYAAVDLEGALNAYSNLSWSSDIPEAEDIGTYYVIYRVLGNDNYNSVPSLSTLPTNEEIQALKDTVIPVSIEAARLSVSVPEEAIVVEPDAVEEGIYTVTAGKTYTIYSNITLIPEDKTGLTIMQGEGNENYKYMYSVTFAKSLTDGTQINFDHKHAVGAFSTDTTHTDTDKVWVKCDGEPNEAAKCVAYIDTEGTYYYGEAPTDADIVLSEYYGAVPSVAEFFFTKKGDATGAHVSAENMEIGETYVVNAIISVDLGNDVVSNLAITKEIAFEARPMTMNEYYLVTGYTDEGEPIIGENPLEIVDGVITVPAETFTYNGEDQLPDIVIVNPGNDEELHEYHEGAAGSSLASYTNSKLTEEGSYTDAGDYSIELEAVKENNEYSRNYTGKVTVKWSIAKADAEVSAVPVENIIYDGQILDDTDFTFTDAQGVLDSAGAQVTVESAGSVEEGVDSVTGVVFTGIKDTGNCVISGRDGDSDGINISNNSSITSKNGEIIKKIVMVNSYGAGNMPNLGVDHGDISISGKTMTIDNINAEKVVFTKSTGSYCQFKDFTIYYETDTATDLTSAGDHTAKITITSKNYNDIELEVPVTINKRSVTLTPAEGQKYTFGDDDVPEITYEVEEQNDTDKTGFIASDLAENQTAAEFFGNVVMIGKEIDTTNILNAGTDDDFDYDDFNDAGTYGYYAEEADNYELIIADGAFFTVDPKNIASNDIEVTLTYTEFNYDATTHITDVESVMFGETELVKDVDFTVGGTLRKVYPGDFTVQVSGQGNYTGIAYSGWKINAIDGEASINKINGGVKTYDGTDVSDMFEVDLGDIPAAKATITYTYYDNDGVELKAAPKDAGTYTVQVKITAKGYADEIILTDLTIEPAEVTVSGSLDKDSIVYTDEAPVVADTEITGILDDEFDDFNANTEVVWTLDEANHCFTGVVNTTDAYSNNYTFTVEPVVFAVAPKDIESSDITVTYSKRAKLADGAWTICDDIVVTDSKTGATLVEGQDYELNGNTTKKAGTFTIEILGINNYNGIKEVPWTVLETLEEATLKTATVSFGGALGLNINAEISDDLAAQEGAYVLMTVNGRETKVFIKDASKKNGAYVFTVPVYSTEINDTITLQVFNESDEIVTMMNSKGIDYENSTFEYSVAEYLNRVLALEGEGYDTVKALASATLDYGTASQLYFGHNDDGLAVSEAVNAVDADVLDDFAITKTAEADRPEGITASMSVEYGSDNTIMVTYTLPDGKTDADYTFTIDGEEAEIDSIGNNKYVLKVQNIAPDKFAENYTFSCSDGEKEFAVTANVLAYANAIRKAYNTDNTTNLAKAMYLYYQAASNYAASF